MLHKIYSQDLYCNELKKLFRLSHRITEPGCDLWRYLIQSSAQGGSAGAGCPGPYPDGFWMASLVENAQALCQSIPVFDHHLIFTFMGKKGSPQSYRPVSLTSIPQKGYFKATNPGKHFHTHEEHEDGLKWSAWICYFPLELYGLEEKHNMC